MEPTYLIPIYKSGSVVGMATIDFEDRHLVDGYRFRFDKKGYVIGAVPRWPRGKAKYLHRIVMREPDGICDHRFGVLTDCRKSQLRITDYFGNSQNRVNLSRNNKSGYRGVSWHVHRKKWEVKAETRGKRYCGGYFSDPADAHKAACELRQRLGFLHG